MHILILLQNIATNSAKKYVKPFFKKYSKSSEVLYF